MRHSFITFRSHPTEKHLDDEFLSMIQPKLNKNPKYILAYECQGSIDSHWHIILSFPDTADISNMKQAFNTKAWQNWYSQFDGMTEIQWSKSSKLKNCFNEKNLQIQIVGDTDEDYYHTVGYITKEGNSIIQSKGYTNEEIKHCTQFYYLQSRNKPKVDKTWRILNIKTVHAYIEDYCQKNNISVHDPALPVMLTRDKVYIDLNRNSYDRVMASLKIANDEEKFKELNPALYTNAISEVSYTYSNNDYDEISEYKKEIVQLKLLIHDLTEKDLTPEEKKKLLIMATLI